MPEVIALIVTIVILGVVLVLQESRHAEEADAWRDERADLLQRIQAPDRAVTTHASQAAPRRAVPAVGFDDDDDAQQALEARRARI